MDERTILLDALRQRRSIRKFTDEALTNDEILAVLEAGRWAPSGMNNQPWRFLVLRSGDERCEALAGLTKYSHVLRGGDTLFVVLLDKAAMYSPRKDYQGAGACIQNMLLAIHGLGLGAVWLGEIINQEAEVLPALGLDADAYELMTVIVAGHPAQKGSSDRKPLSELLLEKI
ncbi:MAG: nitroreductase family protein [Desulfovibrio sp.]|uniref:nitroreductase family protein n=1 Tax=Desulfovibrio sp. 7SRBS1 TaxID=3378064 RepID=UPI003B3EBB15